MRLFLLEAGEITFAAELEATSPKVLLLAAASYFETAVVDCIVSYFDDILDGDEPRHAFVYLRGLKRQYHTLFKWDSRNVNTLWSQFGSEFKAYAVARVSADAVLQQAAIDFLELGALRNGLVHQNYASFTLDKTLDEIFALALSALMFVERLPEILGSYEPLPEP